MGAAKFPEEIVERQIEDSYSVELFRYASLTAPVAPKPTLKYCPLCYEGYIEDSALDNHIALRHGKQHVFLKLNDQVVRDVCWLKGPVRECKLVVLNVPRVAVSLTINGDTKDLTISETTELSEHLAKGSVDSAIRIEIRSAAFARDFTVYQGKQPSFRSDRIDRSVAGTMNEMRAGEIVDLAALREIDTKHKLNELEIRYLNGIVEYCHGLNLENERKRELARSRLESSMDLLIPFRTVLAEDLRHALALRMNCFLGQWGCSDGSPFQIAEQFFCTSLDHEGVTNEVQQSNRIEVPIDPVSRLILKALRTYKDRDDGMTLRILASIQVRDRNDEDKVNLITARAKARMGDLDGARATYQSFRDHPIFGKQAADYLRASGQM